jgi:hypothetical protein
MSHGPVLREVVLSELHPAISRVASQSGQRRFIAARSLPDLATGCKVKGAALFWTNTMQISKYKELIVPDEPLET